MRRARICLIVGTLMVGVVFVDCVGDDPAATDVPAAPDATTAPDGNTAPAADGGGRADNEAPAVDADAPTDSGADAPTDSGADAGCEAPREICGGSCVNTRVSRVNCGRCGHACTGTADCVSGRCANEIVDVALGDGHSCAAFGNGDVWCWGSNARGQLGVPITSPIMAPTRMPITDVIRLAASYESTCAVKKDNTVWCWGANPGGVLGHPTGQGSPLDLDCEDAGAARCNSVPQQVLGLPKADEVFIGTNWGCARTLAGTVACWGSGSCGNLGTPDAGSGPIALVGEVANVANVKHLADSCGQARHTCVILNDGSLTCWGSNDLGQCGHAPEPEPPSCGASGAIAAPAVVPGLADVTSVAVSARGVTCATANAGKVYCWGHNGDALVTPPASAATPTPTPTLIDVGAIKATKVVMGDAHACALLEDQTLRCWGFNGRGQLGVGLTDQVTYAPRTVTGVSTARGLWSGRAYSAVVLAGGSLAMWGGNGLGQLAQQGVGSNGTATAVSGLP